MSARPPRAVTPGSPPAPPSPASRDDVARELAPLAARLMGEHVAVAVRPLAAGVAVPDATRLLQALHPAIHPWLLESSRVDGRLGRCSLLGVDPFAVLTARGRRLELDLRRAVRDGGPTGHRVFEGDPFEAVRALWPRTSGAAPEAHARLPFVGGAIAVFGYELAEHIESLELSGRDDLETPDLALLLVDRLVSIDHARGEAVAIALGFGDTPAAAHRAGEAAAGEWHATVAAALARLDAPAPEPDAAAGARATRAEGSFVVAAKHAGADAIACNDEGKIACNHEGKDEGVDPGPGAEEYARRVRRILAEIECGNVYEVNLTQRMSEPFEASPLALYRALRQESPAPFAAYLELPGVSIVGSSPERFLRLAPDGSVESRPIKGTRRRGATPDRDAALAEELLTSPKDRAENLMIVDLVRNDLGRVCRVGSVRVPELMQVETYATVFQLVSTVTGQLRDDCDGIDLVRACFPPGSMTGAPKIAAMRIAAALEPVRRGLYSGALGYLDVRGGLDLSVVIRTLLVKDGRAHLHVGGAVVADSDPMAEYEESLDKARALRAALERTTRGDEPGDQDTTKQGRRG